MLSLVDGEGCFVMLHFGYSSMIDFPELKLWGQGVNFDRLLMHVAKSPPPAIPGSATAFFFFFFFSSPVPSYRSQASLSRNEGSQRRAVQSTAYPPSTHAVPLGKET